MSGAGNQLQLALELLHERPLFSQHFLTERLPDWEEFSRHDPSPLFERLSSLWHREGDSVRDANEAQTEERFIRPALRELGFTFTVQADVGVGRGRRQPDYALFLTEPDRVGADRLSGAARYRHAVAVADAKRFDRPLEQRRAAGALSEDPVAQIIHYISITRRRWGILTNGRLWRLYAAEGDLVEGACHQIDLVALLEAEDPVQFRYFAAFFSTWGFTPDAGGETFLDRALRQSRATAVAVGGALQTQVFGAVPLIATGLLGEEGRTEAALASAFDHSLVLLYRVLFCLHAEARGLLPLDNPHYRPYSLERQRASLSDSIGEGRIFSSQSDDLYNDLRALFRMVDRGDPALAVNEYDGGLFSPERHPYLAGRSVPDNLLAQALDRLYRVSGSAVDYRDLSVRHLGTIYEHLLDYRLVEHADGLRLEPATGRRESGSYFTPEPVVDLIVERALEPILEARSQAIAQTALSGEDALESFLELRVLDPAMGSGHFLVSAAARIGQYIATDPSYDGDLPLIEIQRLVAERCLYGVDLNPMAVELARLSLWLTTVRGDEPLTFLRNLRTGNSLVGADLLGLLSTDGTVFADRLARDADAMLSRIAEIDALRTLGGDDVAEKERLDGAIEDLRRPLEETADEAILAPLGESSRPFLHWEIEFPEVFLSVDGRPRSDAGFDAVVGNPPYVRIQALGRDLAEYCRRHYQTASGSFDAYIPFLERGISLLAPGGRLGFIVPNKLLKLDYGECLRERLAGEALVEELIDFGHAQVFAGATNYTCVLVLSRAGSSHFIYRRVGGDESAVREALIQSDTIQSETFAANDFGSDPWVLATGAEAELLRAVSRDAARLDEVTRQIFQGLITSADPVYILEARGTRGGRRIAYSSASGQEVELEPDLLHPLARGGDVDRYGFKPLEHLLLFPYRRTPEGQTRLLNSDELSALPLTEHYLRSHESLLRSRERGRMDHEGWYAFGRTQSLGAHELSKLGVAATVRHLEVAADPGGHVYFHNVRVNGILPSAEAPSLWVLLVLLNARLLDWIFRRGAAEHAGGHYAANKQFIAPLPIRVPTGEFASALEDLGQRLHGAATAIARERHGFLSWLAGVTGARAADLSGVTTLRAYDDASVGEVVAVLRSNRSRLSVDPERRSFHDELAREHATSARRIADMKAAMIADESAAEAAVYELYELTDAQRALVDGEYTRAG